MKITIPDIPPSNNKYLGRSHSFHIYHEEKKVWMNMVGWSVKAVGWQNKPLEKALVRITYYFPDRKRRDPDNYSGKFLLDGLKQAGVIADDSFKNIELVLAGDYDKKNPRTEIEIREVNAL